MNILKNLIGKIYKFRHKDYFNFSDSTSYWISRYRSGDNSGSGSYGRLAVFKAEVINSFLKNNEIELAIEFGCGDGNQLSLIKYKKYIGVDVSKEAIKICKNKFKGDETKDFVHIDNYKPKLANLSLSLDVIFHLVEDSVFEMYMWELFNASKKFVIIYSSNFESQETVARHVKHRKFSDWISNNVEEYKLVQLIKNKYPYSGDDDTSFADFYVYSR